MTEQTLIEAAKAVAAMFPSCGSQQMKNLRAAIEREEQRQQWEPGDKAVIFNSPGINGRVICVEGVKETVHIRYIDYGPGHWVVPSPLRRPTPEELENWPGGEE